MQSLVFHNHNGSHCQLCDGLLVTETLSPNKKKKKKKEEIKTAAIFCINGFPPGSVGAAGGCSGYLTWIFQACSYALGSSALHFM